MDLLLFLYVFMVVFTFVAIIIRKELKKDFFPFFIGSVCGLVRSMLGYGVPSIAEFFIKTGLSALAVTAIVTIFLEATYSRRGKEMFGYLYFYVGVTITAFVSEFYGVNSGFWENMEQGLLSLPWRGILVYYFFTFFAVLKIGELISALWLKNKNALSSFLYGSNHFGKK